jgi:hypothetical protein
MRLAKSSLAKTAGEQIGMESVKPDPTEVAKPLKIGAK